MDWLIDQFRPLSFYFTAPHSLGAPIDIPGGLPICLSGCLFACKLVIEQTKHRDNFMKNKPAIQQATTSCYRSIPHGSRKRIPKHIPWYLTTFTRITRRESQGKLYRLVITTGTWGEIRFFGGGCFIESKPYSLILIDSNLGPPYRKLKPQRFRSPFVLTGSQFIEQCAWNGGQPGITLQFMCLNVSISDVPFLCLPTYVHASLFANLSACLTLYLFICPLTYLPFCLPTYLPSCWKESGLLVSARVRHAHGNLAYVRNSRKFSRHLWMQGRGVTNWTTERRTYEKERR